MVSWGYFEIEITIFWQAKTGQQIPHTVTHELEFEPGGAKKSFKLKFDKTKLGPIFGPARKEVKIGAAVPRRKSVVPVKKNFR